MRGWLNGFWRRGRWLARLAAGLAVVVVATLLPQLSAAAFTPSWSAPSAGKTRSVKTKRVAIRKRGPNASAKAALRSAPKAAWPQGGTAVVSLGAAQTTSAVDRRLAPVRAGKLPVWVGQAAPRKDRQGRRTTPLAPARVRVQVLDRKATSKAGLDGLLVRLGAADANAGSGRVAVRLDYSAFRHAIGGDWASRLRLIRLPECALVTPGRPGCAAQPVPGTWNDVRSGVVTGEVDVQPRTLMALAAGASGAQGDFAATSLSPSATWQVSNQTGSFSWSYPIRIPSPQSGPTPKIALSYSSSSVDGRTSSTNNQPSWIGEGFDYHPGFIERKHKSCGDDGETGSPPPGDQCWAGANATLSLNGAGGELVKDDQTGEWHPKNDDGMRIEHKTGAPNDDNDGEYWVVTTGDGTQYYFGKTKWNASATDTKSTWTVPVAGNDAGEPCHGASFAGSFCPQAWRWNLDYVVDPRGNAMALYYGQEINYYAKNKVAQPGTEYVRGGYVTRIDYGLRTDDISPANAPYRVTFGIEERCLSDASFNCDDAAKFTEANKSHWPDVPVDQNCDKTDTCTNKNSPTFWTRKRLTGIATHVWNGSAYDPVDSWAFRQEFPAGELDGTSLWLADITHTGKLGGGTAAMPKVVFRGTQLPNRVDGVDSLPAFVRWRIQSIDNESGGTTNVTYSSTECTTTSLPAPESNTKRCYPQRIVRPGATDPNDLITDWMHKYVVTQVSNDDRVGGAPSTVTHYQYLDKPAWHYVTNDAFTPAKFRTWSEFRGYSKVRVLQGSPNETQSRTDYLYFRGMDGDRSDPADASKTRPVKITDSEGTDSVDDEELQGFLREQITYNGVSGPEVSGTITTPWMSGPTASQGRLKARRIDTAKTRIRTALPLQPGGYRRTEVRRTFNSDGTVKRIWDLGDVGSSPGAADDRCTHYTYTGNDAKGITALIDRSWTDAVPCEDPGGAAVTPTYPADAISDVTTDYDLAYGEPTVTKEVSSYSGGTPQYVTTKRTVYDGYGRVKETYDGLDHLTSTTYTPATGNPVTAITATNAKGHAETQTLNALGSPVKTEDPNHNVTTMLYDPLGRLLKVWVPGRTTAQTPNAEFSYQMTGTAPSVVTSKQLLPYGGQKTTYQIFDGLLRPRQAQAPTSGSGRVLTDVYYDTRGQAWKTNQPYYDKANAPSGVLSAPVDDNQVPGQTLVTFDGAGRATESALYSYATKKWSTTYAFQGDRSTVTPPAGGVASTTLTNARGQVTELWQANGSGFDKSFYAYTNAGQLDSVKNSTGQVWKYGYDLRGNQTSVTSPDQGTSSMVYDEAGQLRYLTASRKVNATDHQKLRLDYDELGRKTGMFDESAAGKPQLAGWVYDTVAIGKLTKSIRYVGGAAGQQYVNEVTAYDKAYRPTASTITIPAAEGNLGKTYSSTTSYNLDGSVDTQTLPAAGSLAAETMTYGYNSLGYLTGVRGRIGTTTTTYAIGASYTEFGELDRLQLGTSTAKAVWRTNSYDAATRRLTESRIDRANVATPDDDVHYTYDPAGNITKIANTPAGGTADIQCFSQDSLLRLTEAWTPKTDDNCQAKPTAATAGSLLGGPAPYWQSYGYSITGNKTTQVDHNVAGDTTKDAKKTFAYNENGTNQPNTLTSATTVTGGITAKDTYTYDEAGALTQRVVGGNTQTLQWDPEGRLAKFTKSGKDSTYLYDADGELLLRRQPGATVLYLDGQELSMNAAGTITGTRYYAHGGSVIAVRTQDSAKPLTFLVSDRLGTAQLAVDASTHAITRRRYTPFGSVRNQDASVVWPGQKGYLGGTNDPETGLTHLGAREYDTTAGRFISGDPVFNSGDPQSWNGYAYADNSPITNSDPTGTLCRRIDGYLECFNGDGVDRRPNADGNGYTVYKGGKAVAQSGDSNTAAAEAQRRQALERQAAAMRARVAAAQARVRNAVMGIIKIAADELGITAGLNCFSKGDLGACGETALNLIQSSVGGIVGKILARYGAPWQWAKAGRLAKKLWNLANDVGSGLVDFFKYGKQAKAAEAAVAAERKLENVATSCTVPNSFTPETRVKLANGKSKPIKDVKIGDKVLATDPVTGKTKAEPVVATITGHGQKDLVRITVTTAATKTAAIVATANHPIWSATTRTWTQAADLNPGDTLQTPDGQTIKVQATQRYTHNQVVNNLTVTDLHTYYVEVGDTSVLAHNCNRAGKDFTDAEREKVYQANLEANDGVLTCEYCGQEVVRRPSQRGVPGRPDDAQIDHVEPRVSGGHGGAHNGAVACRRCNRDKSTKPIDVWDDELRDLLDDE